MHKITQFISLLSLNLIPAIIFANEAMIPAKIEMTSPAASAPAVVGDNTIQSPIIKVMINDQGPFLFALDTGFSETLISKQLVEKLKLPIIKKNQVTYVTPHATTKEFENIVLIHKIQISNMSVFDYAAIGTGNSAQDEIKFKKRGIDGLISINMFQGVLLKLDYKNEMLHIEKGQLSPADKDVLPYRQGDNIPVIEVHIQSDKIKEIPYYFILDTGEPNYIYINACGLPVKDLFKDQEKFMQYDLFENASETFMAQLNGNIKFSESTFIKSPHVTFSEKDCNNTPPMGRFGRKFFETHEITFDNKNGLVKINPNHR